MTPGKRALDVVVSLGLLGLLWPVMACIAALVLLCDGRPVFFGARRMGAPNRPFTMWKFRTMRPHPADCGVTGGDKSRRITPLGRLLRRSRLDELPQLWNVIRGEMSLVGPRPPAPEHVACAPRVFTRVLAARPGITGLATLMLHGREARILSACTTPVLTEAAYRCHCLPWKTRVDLLYLRHRSLAWDLWLLLATLLRGLPPRGPLRRFPFVNLSGRKRAARRRPRPV